MKKLSSAKEIASWKAIVLAYRKGVEERYQYDFIHQNFEVPASFTSERLENFRSYFLEYLYPHPDKREELNEAFESLEKYIKSPSKLIRIFIDSSSILLKYGTQIPSIIKAGLQALNSFQSANNFEQQLLKNALLFEMEPPYDIKDVNYLISTLKRKEIDDFIKGTETLFNTLHNRVLVEKIIEITQELIHKMRENPKSYSPTEIKGFEMGFEIIRLGNELFIELSPEEQEKIFDITLAIETKVLNEIFEN